ncbi:hypothetical protein [Leadbettera azotonutricia]|uniref:Uncharacterized protein n=1 Tax=Leadbettera azotonutricia (strain ATCC BAA-888 / DSM 13862 / ZAS-9) TaxID=545695 RepID=F5YBH7_LEAAZ|nr:hypothetical protein [Leadbettera azotonutricia]AEF81645.1 hypothetical protein TREAZ_0608 [Leadbettera azotonutricia ZAS-9]
MDASDYEANVDGLIFWPEDDLRAAFDAVATETIEHGELFALKAFNLRMKYYLNTSSDVCHDITYEGVAAHYEKSILESGLVKLRCGACPVPGCPYGGAK